MASAKAASSGNYLSFAACIALCLPAPLSGVAQAVLGPVMPQMTAHFAEVPNAGALVRATVSGLGAAMIVGSLAAGHLAERFGQLRVLLAVLIIYAISGTAGFFLDDLELIVASRVVLGAVNAVAGAVAMGILMTRVAPDTRERWMGFYIVGSTIGSVVILMVIGAIAHLGWRYAFLPHLLALPITVFIALAFPAPSKESVPRETSRARPGHGFPWTKVAFGVLFGAATSSSMMYLPFHLDNLGMGDPSTVATAFAAVTFAGGAGSSVYGWVRGRLSAFQVFIVSLIMMFAGMAAVAAAHNILLVCLAMAVFGVGLGLLVPNFLSAGAATAPPEARTRVLGQIRGAYYAGPLAAQPLLEVVVNGAGTAASILAIGLMALAGAILVVAFRGVFTPYEARADTV